MLFAETLQENMKHGITIFKDTVNMVLVTSNPSLCPLSNQAVMVLHMQVVVLHMQVVLHMLDRFVLS